MNKKTLIINTGSASKRHALYVEDKKVSNSHFEKCCDNKFTLSLTTGEVKEKNDISEKIFLDSTEYYLNLLKSKNIIEDKKEIETIGLRIVAPGRYFLEDKLVDENYLNELIKIKESAPLHINPVIDEINYLNENFEKGTIVGISDSKFHVDIPEYFRYYSIKKEDTEKYDIHRYGYHGISVSSIIRKIKEDIKNIPENIIVCHLGSGSSVTAVKNGKSFNTSMGFTPLEGLTMRTRVGNIDPGALVYLAKKKSLNFDDIENYLNMECGLLGLSGEGDTRKIVDLVKEGNKNAILALDVYSNDVREYIGSYFVLLSGLDTLIFSGAVGEGSYVIRSKICSDMEHIGIKIDEEKNKNTINANGIISTENSPVKVMVLITNETEEIFRNTKEVLVNSKINQ